MFASSPPLDCGALAGRHVRLEPLSLGHLDGLLSAATGPRDSYTWTTIPATADEMRRYLEHTLAVSQAGAAVPFATIDQRDGSVVGSTRFANLELCQLPLPSGKSIQVAAVEIGWTWLAARAQRTGINTEAKLLMLTHAFEHWNALRVVLKTHEKNTRSRAAIERIGARLDGLTTNWMPGEIARPTAWFSLLASRWPEVKERLTRRLAH